MSVLGSTELSLLEIAPYFLTSLFTTVNFAHPSEGVSFRKPKERVSLNFE